MTKEKAKSNAGNKEYRPIERDEICLVFWNDGSMSIDRVGLLDNYNRNLVQQVFFVPEDTTLDSISGYFARGMKDHSSMWRMIYPKVEDNAI